MQLAKKNRSGFGNCLQLHNFWLTRECSPNYWDSDAIFALTSLVNPTGMVPLPMDVKPATGTVVRVKYVFDGMLLYSLEKRFKEMRCFVQRKHDSGPAACQDILSHVFTELPCDR